MKKTLTIILSLFLIVCFLSGAAAEGAVTIADLIIDLTAAGQDPTAEAVAKVDADVAALDDPVAEFIADHWKNVWLDPDYRLFMYGKDDPSALPVTGRHAFVVLGYALKNGEMADELIGRCDAAAACARAFPDSILVCSGGATGSNNPENHTEAGLMKAYLVETHGIAPERIFTDELAMTTAENARYTLEILREQDIETMTIVTSDYHQLRGQTLYNAMAARYLRDQGYRVEIVGNFCWPTDTYEDARRQEMRFTANQMATILELPDEERQKIIEAGR